MLPPIARDVAMGGSITEDQAISWDQYLDLVYSQSGNIYDLIPQAPRPSIDPAKPPTEVPIDGIVGSIQSPSAAKPAKQPQISTPTPSTPKFSAEVILFKVLKPQVIKRKVKIKIKNLETSR